jgi:hypothetical protein
MQACTKIYWTIQDSRAKKWSSISVGAITTVIRCARCFQCFAANTMPSPTAAAAVRGAPPAHLKKMSHLYRLPSSTKLALHPPFPLPSSRFWNGRSKTPLHRWRDVSCPPQLTASAYKRHLKHRCSPPQLVHPCFSPLGAPKWWTPIIAFADYHSLSSAHLRHHVVACFPWGGSPWPTLPPCTAAVSFYSPQCQHQMKCMLGKMETFSHLASDEITNLGVKLYNICRV